TLARQRRARGLALCEVRALQGVGATERVGGIVKPEFVLDLALFVIEPGVKMFLAPIEKINALVVNRVRLRLSGLRLGLARRRSGRERFESGLGLGGSVQARLGAPSTGVAPHIALQVARASQSRSNLAAATKGVRHATAP